MPDASRTSLSRTFARFVTALEFDALPHEVVDKIKASVLHAMVTAIVGADTGHGKASVELAKAEESLPGGATILVDGTQATRCGAAFANSKLMHATNQSDSYRMLIHPGPCNIPAALASAEMGAGGGSEGGSGTRKPSGQDFLTALVAGYEVEARIAGDFIPSTQARGFRSSPVYGTLGAAVTTGKLLRLTEDQMVTALALACTFTGGTTEGASSGGQEMLFHEPNATRNGIMAALLARENVRGSETALEGNAGFYTAFTGNNRGDLTYSFLGPNETDMSTVTEGLGSRWEVMHVTPKIYQTAGYNCPVIDLMTQIRTSHEIAPDTIESITIDMNWLETLYPSPEFPNPQRTSPGVGSTHYFAAYTCINGHYPPLKPRLDPGISAPRESGDVMDLMRRVYVVGHRDRPAFAPRITIEVAGGNTYQGEYHGDELKWDLATEVRRISALFPDMSWPTDRLIALVDTVSLLEKFPDITQLVQLCVRR